jgi:hypothetical protein
VSLARKVAREQAAPRRKRLTKALQKARRGAVIDRWTEDALDREIVAECAAIDTAIDLDPSNGPNGNRVLAAWAAAALLVTVLAGWIASGC